ncbi:MAG TPA: hypothetical protein VEU55_09200 [Gemmatimonadales bacterium]|nr:hypothetical protein [Gemmatimonadales bacterium]
MKLLRTATLGALALVAWGATGAPAQTTCNTNPCSLNNTASVTVGTVLRLTISSATTALTPPTETAYDAGFQLDAGPTLTVKANRSWTLKAAANAANWTAALGANAAKAAGDLQWSLASGGTYTGLTQTGTTVATGTQGGPGTAEPIFYKTLWSYANDTPGDYSLVVVYTLSAP